MMRALDSYSSRDRALAKQASEQRAHNQTSSLSRSCTSPSHSLSLSLVRKYRGERFPTKWKPTLSLSRAEQDLTGSQLERIKML